MGARKLVTLLLVAVVVILAARYLFWNDRRDVRRRLTTIADAVNAGGSDLGAFLTDDVIIRTDPATIVGGRPAVVKLVRDAVAARGQVKVSLGDVQVELIDPSTATVFFTGRISGGDPRVPDPAPRQLHATFVKQGGDWRLTRAEVQRILEER
jgi:hypothetical protein